MAQPYLEAQARNGAATPYLVHFLLDQAVPVDRAALIDALRARLGRVEPVDGSGEALHFSLPEYVAQIGEIAVPVQLAVLALEGISVDELAASLRQSWTWPDAGEVASRCRASLSLADFYGSGLHRRIRLALFHGAASALLELLPVRAIQWMPSQQVIAPGAYLEQLRTGEGLRGSAINVRRFRLGQGSLEQVLDTVGLGAFGLPDLEVRLQGGDVPATREWLFAQATELFETGALSGASEERASTAPPTRTVLGMEAPRPGSG